MRKILMILALSILLMSCHRRDIYYENVQYANLHLEVDWTQAFPLQEDKPKGMSVWFYPIDGGGPIMKSTNEVDNYHVRIPVGTYDVLVFNQTPHELSRSLSFKDIESLDEAEVYTVLMDYKSWYEEETGDNVDMQPLYIAVAKYDDLVVIPNEDLEYTFDHEEQLPDINVTVKVTPEMITKDLEIVVYVENAASISDTRAVVSGLAKGHKLTAEYPNSESCTNIIKSWEVDTKSESTNIVFNLTSFGYRRSIEDVEYNLSDWEGELQLRFLLHDEHQVTYTIPLDETNIVDTGDRLKMKLVVGLSDALVLPDITNPDNGSAGFNPDVSEWPEEDIVMPIE